jgi:hypothetical protein
MGEGQGEGAFPPFVYFACFVVIDLFFPPRLRVLRVNKKIPLLSKRD